MHPETRLAHLARDARRFDGAVNLPVMRASTVLFEDTQHLKATEKTWWEKPYYGRHGLTPTFAFEEAIAGLEGGYKAIAVESGLAALTCALSAFLKSGDHVLIHDAAYGPVRHYCDDVLRRFGVEVTYYHPSQDIAALIRPHTRVLHLEAPGSITFEMQDIPALSALAQSRGVITVLDNTWATPLYFQGCSVGVDVVTHAATKYLVGHSDALLGVMVARNEAVYHTLKTNAARHGHHAAPDDLYLALRGMRTLAVRLARHQDTALRLMTWLADHPLVARILSPAYPEHEGHALWKRDFSGASGLFSCVMNMDYPALCQAVDRLTLFGLGYSWGGFESLAIPFDMRRSRTAQPWTEGPVLRIHAGLEHPDDLIGDLANALG
jgi:cystathionine beta-lyase